jgi:hypothetical protein
MLNVGLPAAEVQKYYTDLAVSHEVRISIRLMTLSHVPVTGDVSGMLLEGQVDGQLIEVDRLASGFAEFDDPCILHTLSMKLLDPGFSLGFESGSPSDAAIYLNRMVEVVRYDYCPSLAKWVACPMFLGPVSNLERNDDVVTIAAQSKEALAANPADLAVTYPAMAFTSMIADLLIRTGETAAYIGFPGLSTMTGGTLTTVRESRPFAKAYWLAMGLGVRLFYDARGVARFTGGTTPVFKFDGTNLLEFPNRGYGTDQVVNTVRVIVGDGAGDVPKYDVVARLPASHPNSASALGRNGVARANLVTITDDNIATLGDAQVRATHELAVRQNTVTGTQFTALCVPPLELGDYISIVLDGKIAIERVSAFSKPLRVDGVMSVGQTQWVGNAGGIWTESLRHGAPATGAPPPAAGGRKKKRRKKRRR